MDVHAVHQSSVEFKESKSKWKSRWAILQESDRNSRPDDLDTDNIRSSSYTSLVIRKNKEGEVRLIIPLYYLCLVDKYIIDKKTYGITLVVYFRSTNTAETYLLQCDSLAQTDLWLGYFNSIVGLGMHKFEIKLPKNNLKTKYNGPAWLYFYEEQKFVTIVTDNKIPQYYGTWPIQLLRRYGGDDPNKFVFESGRRCFGGVSIHTIASAQAFDIRGLCNKVSSATPRVSNTGATPASNGYGESEPRYRNFPSGGNPRVRSGERPLTVVSNGSVASNTSKRSSGSSSTGGDSARQMSLDRNGARPTSDTIDSGISFRSSNNSILSNRSSRGSYSSDLNMHDTQEDSGVDTLESRNGTAAQSAAPSEAGDPHDMYMIMQPGGVQTPVNERVSQHPQHPQHYGKGPADVYECMVQTDRQEGYTMLRNGSGSRIQDNSMSDYMVPKPVAHLAATSPMTPVSPKLPGVKHINYPSTPQTVAQVSPSDNYMNMGPYAPSSAFSNYMNIDSLQTPPPPAPPPAAAHSNYMNIDMLSRSLEQNISVDGGYGNYMNMPTVPDSSPLPPPPARKVAVPQPIYDTPTNHLLDRVGQATSVNHLRAYANVEGKCITMSVSNPIYGNCGATAQKLQT